MTIYPHITMHYELLEQITREKNPEIKKRLCLEDISIFPEFRKELLMQADEIVQKSKASDDRIGEHHPLEYYKRKYAHNYIIPRFPSFKALAIIYEREGEYEEAIGICKDAIKLGLQDDGTKGGMTERIRKLQAKLDKENG